VRWRLYTPRHRLIGVPSPEPARSEWHRADAAKGRRLLAVDVRNSNRVAAFLSWHFEDPDIKPPRAKAGRRRPHLITSVCVRQDVEGRLRGEYMTAALLLTLVVSAIDTVTVAHGRVGVLEDSGIVLASEELDAFGFTPGVGEPNGGWSDRGYRERCHPV
jgi:hypothetical protein